MTPKEFLYSKGITNAPHKTLVILRDGESFDIADVLCEYAAIKRPSGCKIEVNQLDHLLHGIYLWDYAYSLDGAAFDEQMESEIKSTTGLQMGSLGDWWVSYTPGWNHKSWKELIVLSVNILQSRATKIFVASLYADSLDYRILNACKDLPTSALPDLSVSGAKRINADCVEHFTSSDKKLLDKFRLYGKDEGCSVEGSWIDWCLFACNVLASENTKLACPEIYVPDLKNDHY